MSLISLLITLFLTSSHGQNEYIQFTAEQIVSEKLPFSKILMNINHVSNIIAVDFEIQRIPESHDVSNIYQISRDNKFYSSKFLEVEAKQKFLHCERLFDPATWDTATMDDVNSVYLTECIDLNLNPKWIQNMSIVGPIPLNDTLFRDEENQIVIQFLNRQYVLGDFENGVPTKLFILGNNSSVFGRADVTFFEWSTSTPFTTRWSVPLPSDKVCANLTAHQPVISRHNVTVRNDGEMIPDFGVSARRLTGPCLDSTCCPTGLESICTNHKQLFMTHDAYRDATCSLTYAGDQCTQYEINDDKAIICRDYSNTFKYIGENRCYVSFGGSNNDIEEWLNNLNFFSTSWEGYSTHSGFVDEFNGIGMLVYNNLGACLTYNKIEIMGHSLGGALSTLLGIYIAKRHSSIEIQVITVGGPKVFSGTRPSFGSRYHQTSFISEYVDWDSYFVSYYWDPVPYFSPGDWNNPINTEYVWLCYKKDEVCNCYWNSWIYQCDCITYHDYYSQSGECDGSLGLPSIDQHRISAYYNYMEEMNYGQCAQD